MFKHLKAYWIDDEKPTDTLKRRLAFDKESQWDYLKAVWDHCNTNKSSDVIPDYRVIEFRNVLMLHGWGIEIVLGYTCDGQWCDHHSSKGEVGGECPMLMCRGTQQLSSVPVPHYESFCGHCDYYVTICGACGNNSCNAGFGEVDGKPCLDCITAYSFKYDKDDRVIIPEAYTQYSGTSQPK